MIDVLLVDDHHLFREGLTRIIQDTPGMNLIASVQSGKEAIRCLAEHPPDVVIMDVNMPGMGGIEISHQIRNLYPDTQILILTISEKNDDLFDAIRAGARGYILKNSSSQELIEAIRRVNAGESMISPPMAAKLFDEFAALSTMVVHDNKKTDGTKSLTSREREVLRLVARGMSNKEIGITLSISPLTVKAHLGTIFEKLQLRGRVEAAAWAIRNGLLRGD